MSQELRDYALNILRGRKVRLRSFHEDDLHLLESWWNDPGSMIFQNARVVPSSSSSTRDMFRAWSENKDASSYGFCVEQVEDAALVGHVTLWGIDPSVRSATLGIMIGGPHVERGLGTDALQVALRFAFEELDLNKVELSVWEFNSRALHVYERVGFVVEGTRRAATFHAGRFWSQTQMGMLKEEFLRAR